MAKERLYVKKDTHKKKGKSANKISVLAHAKDDQTSTNERQKRGKMKLFKRNESFEFKDLPLTEN